MNHHIPVAKPEIGQEEARNVTEAVRSGWVSSKGPFIEEFEKRFSSFVGMRHGIAVSSGTAALHLALKALGIGTGDDVLVPSLAFIAAANSVTYTGATSVFVDSHPDYWCMDPRYLEKRITKRTKAVMLVHLYGHPCDIDPIMDIARRENLRVIEDCAEAHGAEYRGKRVGSFGDVSCFSFFGNKIITTGEGGMCMTNDQELNQKIRILRDHGMSPTRRYWHDIIGFNYRMTNLQAALGVAQLGKIERLVERKREIAEMYNEVLGQTSGITCSPEMSWAKSSYWFYSILLNSNRRDQVMMHLVQQGIETRPFFHPIHTLPPYRDDLNLPVAEDLSGRGLNLPSGPSLSQDELQIVAAAVHATLKHTTKATLGKRNDDCWIGWS